MYAALWRILPGPAWLRILILATLATAVVIALIVWVFPWAADFLLPQDASVGGS